MLALSLFLAGLLTILLPCILPLVPVVLGVSIADRSKWRPLVTIAGMVVSFVGFTFLLQVLLSQFVELADVIRLATYYVLLLFGLGFLFRRPLPQILGAMLGAFFFREKGPLYIAAAMAFGVAAMMLAGRIATRLQQLGTDAQVQARAAFGARSQLTAFIVGLTLGLVWVPCAGPALGFALTLVREEPGPRALLLLSLYGIGAAIPLLLIGYGGQAALESARILSRFSGRIKEAAGVLLILSALAFEQGWFLDLEAWIVARTGYGTLGSRIEQTLFAEGRTPKNPAISRSSGSSDSSDSSSALPILGTAPEFTGLGPWHNSPPLTLQSLRGKVVLVDFWTYSCINCIRTLPYLKGYVETFRDAPFVLVSIHTPEFVFEKDEKNVASAIRKYELPYPVAQDNDYATWNAFDNRYWPAKYLIDAEGRIRYTHFGEGAYGETEEAIRSLLREVGAQSGEEAKESKESKEEEAGGDGGLRKQTPETYLGSRSWRSLQNRQGAPSEDVITYAAPQSLRLHSYALAGQWQVQDDERQVLRSDDGEIRMRFLGSEINLVLGPEEGAPPAEAEVEIDGQLWETFTIDSNDLYSLYVGNYGEHTLVLKIRGKGVAAYAFTFGS